MALNVYDGSMWRYCLKANDHAHCLRALSQVIRCYAWTRRLNLILANGSSHMVHETQAYWASHPRLRVIYTPRTPVG